jgi:HEAT repeat protein
MALRLQQPKTAVFAGWVVLTATIALGQAPAVPDRPEPSKNDAMIQVLLSESTEPALRENHARSLLRDSQSFDALSEVLTGEGHLTAKIILCKTIAERIEPFSAGESHPDIATRFIDPLFVCVFSDNPELATWASRAIARCRDGVPHRLAAITSDPAQGVQKRLAAIDTLKLIPEKTVASALAPLLDDADPVIKQRAAEAMASILGLNPPPSVEELKILYLNSICDMDDAQYLRRQLTLYQKWLSDVHGRLDQQKDLTALWRQKYLEMITVEFDRLSGDQEKLEFLTRQMSKESAPGLKIWAAQKIADWASAASVQTGPVAEPLVQLLVQHIHDNDDRVRLAAAIALLKLIDKAQSAATDLMNQLKNESVPKNQAALLDVLSMFDGQAALAEQALNLLDSPHAVVVAPAARALKNIVSSTTASLTDEQIGLITKKLVQVFAKWPDSLEIRQELILAMRPIAAKEKYQVLAGELFDTILQDTLGSQDENLRSVAVRTLAELYRHQVLPTLLEEKKLLDDPSPAVRFAVLDAIRDYGDASHLTVIEQRLLQEQNPDVAKAARDVFLKILTAMPLADIRRWADNLEKSQNEPMIELHDQIVQALWDAIAKLPPEEVPPDQKRYALEKLARIATRDRQWADAIKWHQMLLELEATAEQKDAWRIALIEAALNYDGQQKMFDVAGESLVSLAGRPAFGPAIEAIGLICDSLDPSDPGQLLHEAQVLTQVIAPITAKLPASSVATWRNRCVQTAQHMVENQLDLLAQTGAENPLAVQLLPKLDSRLAEFPAQQTPEIKKQTLEKYRSLLAAPPTEAPKTAAGPAATPAGANAATPDPPKPNPTPSQPPKP